MKTGPKTADALTRKAEAKTRILRALSRGLTYATAAALEGMARETLRRWRLEPAAEGEAEPFGASCARAKAQGEALPTEVVWRAIEAGDVAVAQWWLERRSQSFRRDAVPEDDDAADTPVRRIRFVRAGTGGDVAGGPDTGLPGGHGLGGLG